VACKPRIGKCAVGRVRFDSRGGYALGL
jgi:hypothetical protein